MIPYCQHQIRPEDREAVAKVLDSPRLTQGPAVRDFEEALAARVGAACAVAVSSGTSALVIALQALGVGPGDEVLVPSLSFLATANAVLLVGATPRFVDIDRETLALDPEDLARKLGPATRGAILVHYAGHAADVAACRASLGADRFLIEDACHALGAESGGRPIGAQSDVACFSFHPAKHITTGEGGAIVCRSRELADRCVRLREHGVERDGRHWRGLGLPAALACEERGGWVYEMQVLAANHRLSDLSAALGRSQLGRLDEILEARRSIAARYAEALSDVETVDLYPERPDTRSAWHLYPIRLRVEAIEGGRAAIYDAMHAGGIGVQVHYIPIHLQPYYRAQLGCAFGDLPETEETYLRLLSLPIFPGLALEDQQRSVDVLRAALERHAR